MSAADVIAEALRAPHEDVPAPDDSDLAKIAAQITLDALAEAGYAVVKVDGWCDHDTLIHLVDSPLWQCDHCRHTMRIAEWHTFKGATHE